MIMRRWLIIWSLFGVLLAGCESKLTAPESEEFAILSFSPDSAAQTAIIKIVGHKLVQDSVVADIFFGKEKAEIITVSPTELQVFVPYGAGSVPIWAVLRGDTAIAPGLFTYLKIVPQLSISSFSPQSGKQGTKVRIYGEGFGTDKAVTKVFFGNQLATIEELTNTEIVAIAPSGEGSVKIRVYNGFVTKEAWGGWDMGDTYYTYLSDQHIIAINADIELNNIAVRKAKSFSDTVSTGISILNKKWSWFNYYLSVCDQLNGMFVVSFCFKNNLENKGSEYYEGLIVGASLDTVRKLCSKVQVSHESGDYDHLSRGGFERYDASYYFELEDIPYTRTQDEIIIDLSSTELHKVKVLTGESSEEVSSRETGYNFAKSVILSIDSIQSPGANIRIVLKTAQ